MRRTLGLGRSIAPERDYQAEYEAALQDYNEAMQELDLEATRIAEDTTMSPEQKIQALKVQKAFTIETANGFRERFDEIQQSAAEHYASEGYLGETYAASGQYAYDSAENYDFDLDQNENSSLETADQYIGQYEDMSSSSYDSESYDFESDAITSENDQSWDLNRASQESEVASSNEQSNDYSY